MDKYDPSRPYDYKWSDNAIDNAILNFMINNFSQSTIEIMVMVYATIVAALIMSPVMDCNTFLEVMLKIECIYISLTFIWLFYTTPPLSYIIVFSIIVVTCCEAVAGLAILIILRTTDGAKAIYEAHKDSLRG
jgi:hypothetical protein